MSLTLPQLAVGEHVRFAGLDHQIISFEAVSKRQETSVRLRQDNGTVRMVLLSALYADLIAEEIGKPGPSIAVLEGLQYREDPDSEDPDNYLGAPFDLDNAPELANPEPPRKPVYAKSNTRYDALAMLEVIPSRARQRALTKEAHLLEAMTGYRSGDPEDALPGEPRPEYDPESAKQTERLVAKALEINKSRATIFRWKRAYEKNQLWGLVDDTAKRGVNPLANMSSGLIKAVLEQSDAETHATKGGWQRFYRRLGDRIRHDPRFEGVTLPPEGTLRPKAEFLLGDKATFGPTNRKRNQALKPGTTYINMEATRPGQVVLMDSTKFDVRYYDPVRNINVKCVLAWALDVCTRTILSWELVPKSDKKIDAIMLLAGALRPEPMRAHWQEELSIRLLGLPMSHLVDHDERFASAAAKPVIYPETIVIDHGKVYVSDDFKRACRKLGINVQNARKIAPTDKAKIERAFKTLGSKFVEHMAGHTGRNPMENGKTSEEQARWSLAEMAEFLAYFIVAVYQKTPHKGLPFPADPTKFMSPNEAYMAAVTRCGWVAAPVSDTLYYELLPTHWLKIHPYGVNILYRVYNDKVLTKYRREPSPYPPPFTAHGKRPGQKAGNRKKYGLVPIRVDPRNLLYVYFHAWKEDAWYGLRWTKAPERLEPFTDTYYKYAREILRTRGGDHTDQEQIAATLLALQQDIDAPENWTTRNRRERAASSERARAASRDRASSAKLANETGEADEVSEAEPADKPDPAKRKPSTKKAASSRGFSIDTSNVIALPIERTGTSQ